MKEGLSFVTAADHGFHQGLEALLKTFMLSNRELAPLRLIVMDCGLKGDFMNGLQQEMDGYAKKERIEIELSFPKADLKRWQVFPPHWESYATYAFLEAVGMVETRHLIFADADMLHFCQLASVLHELEQSGYKMAGVVDNDYSTLGMDYYVNHLSTLSASQLGKPYMNGGYLIFDLERFSAEDLYGFVESLDPQRAHQRFTGVKKFKHDQTIVNAFIKGEFLALPERYNYFCKENARFIDIEERSNFHFVSQPKPWEPGDREVVARELVFGTVEEELCDKDVTELKGHSVLDRLVLRGQLLVAQLMGKKKKVKRYQQAQINAAQLQGLKELIHSWVQ